MVGFVDARVELVPQSVSHGETGRGLPGILEVEVIRLAFGPLFIDVIALGEAGRGHPTGVGEGRGGQEAGQRVGQGIAGLNVVLAAGGGDTDRRVGCSAAESIASIGRNAENHGVPVEAGLKPCLEVVLSAAVFASLPELNDVAE